MVIALLAAASSVHTVRWANAYADRGHTVHLISLHAPTAGLMPAVQVHRLPYRKGLGYVLNGSLLDRLIESLGPDVVNAHYASGYGTLARACKTVQVLLNVWGSDVFEFPDKSPLHRWWLLRNLRHARELVSTSEFMAKRTRSLASDLPQLTVVPFGVEVERFTPADAKHQGPLVVGTVKTLMPKYGIDTLIKAFAELCTDPSLPELRLRIVGGGPEQENLKQLAQRFGMTQYTEFVGPVAHDRVPAELQRMDVYAALSRADSESFGVAVIEASSCGLPVVVSDAGGLPEVVEHGVTGAVVPREDPQAAANALARLVKDAGLREQWGRAGRARVLEQYAWQQCVDRQLEVLQRVAQERIQA